jgi:hypothetical protein
VLLMSALVSINDRLFNCLCVEWEMRVSFEGLISSHK